jgi:diaminohydroxyphosphoribosylaminopyrimidine deaminase / 5-amino-6-(5-phosphoribosylamino)uracil reductase
MPSEVVAANGAGFSADDHRWMARALELAARGLYGTAPNPRVGCVLVRDRRVVGEGWHQRCGGPHAEAHALASAGDLACGATAYVSLEPCAHHGRTPPCAQALVAAGVARVVAAVRDPNPQVDGAGLDRLRAAGVETACGLMESEARALNPGFLSRMSRGRPWVRVKLAASLDARTALASGESRWITGAPARRDVHAWRARSCALVTGIGTVLADDPGLTPRDHPGRALRAAPPLRVVLDRRLRLSPGARLFREPGRVLLLTEAVDACRQQALERVGAEVLRCPDHGLTLAWVLGVLAARAVNEVLIEAGPTLAGAFLAEGLVDELLVYQGMHLLGHAGRPLVCLPEPANMAERQGWQLLDVRHVGQDLRLWLRPVADAG